jgi:penicillin-binding protein 1A
MPPRKLFFILCLATVLSGCVSDVGQSLEINAPTQESGTPDQVFPMSVASNVYLLPTIMTSNQIYVREIDTNGGVIIDCRCGPQISRDEIPKHLHDALIATEDIRFYAHKGFDPISTTRAMFKNILGMGAKEGGSTIEMQLCKNKVLNPEKGIDRKLLERNCAKAVAETMTKSDTLLSYLNSAYFGESKDGRAIYGIEQASLSIFGKHTSDLGLYESAVLIGMLKAPNRYSPLKNNVRADERAQTVLRQMYKNDLITGREYKAARNGKYKRGKLKPLNFEHRYFTDWVMNVSMANNGYIEVGMHIPVTLQVRTQASGEIGFQRAIKKAGLSDSQPASFGAVRADGAVIAMMGDRNYAKSQFNNFVYGKRPPASTFKAIVYAAGVENGVIARTKIYDGQALGEHWKPSLLEGSLGQTTAITAFAKSRNIAAIKVAERFGYENVISLARLMGINEPLPANQNLALGGFEVSPLTMTSAYTTFTNGGVHEMPYGYHAVINRSGQITSLPYRTFTRAMHPKSAKTMIGFLRSVVISGTGKAASIIKNAKGKTGTSDDEKDGWFIGFTGQTVTSVWLGTVSKGRNIPVDGAMTAGVWAGVVGGYN